MTYGLQIETDAGKLLISGDAKCMHYLGTASVNSDPSALIRRYQISASSRPLIFAKIAVGETVCVYNVVDAGGGVWTFDVVGTARLSGTFYCFAALTTESPLDAYGLRTYLSTGQVAFCSTRKPLWLSEVFTFTGASLSPSTMTATYAQSYAAVGMTAYATAQSTPGQGGGVYYLGVQRTSTGHIHAWCTVTSGTGTPTTALNVNAAVFVIETNGL